LGRFSRDWPSPRGLGIFLNCRDPQPASPSNSRAVGIPAQPHRAHLAPAAGLALAAPRHALLRQDPPGSSSTRQRAAGQPGGRVKRDRCLPLALQFHHRRPRVRGVAPVRNYSAVRASTARRVPRGRRLSWFGNCRCQTYHIARGSSPVRLTSCSIYRIRCGWCGPVERGGSRSIQLVIHAELQQLTALVDRFLRDWGERSRRGGKVDARRAEIDVFVLANDRPFVGQCVLNTGADCKCFGRVYRPTYSWG
jgi:hypothetical protein